MSLKKVGAVIIAVLAMCAVMVSSASAAPVVETANARWHVGSSGLTNGQTKPVSCEATTSTTPLELTSELAGLKLKLTATGVECLANEGSGAAIIEQTGAGTTKEPWVAEDFGRIRFKEVSVDEPAGCEPTSATTTTEPLKTEIYEEKEGSTVLAVFDRFEPLSGATGAFIKLGFKNCILEGQTPSVTGTAFGLAETATGSNAQTGELLDPQRLKFDAGVQTTAGGVLKLGNKAATLMGTVDNKLTPTENFGVSSS